MRQRTVVRTMWYKDQDKIAEFRYYVDNALSIVFEVKAVAFRTKTLLLKHLTHQSFQIVVY